MCALFQLKELEELTKSFATVEIRSTVEEKVIENIVATFKSEVKKPDPKYEIILECLRSLRNVVAGVENNQKFVATILHEQIDFWNFCSEIIPLVDKDQMLLSNLRCSVQLLGNLMVGQTAYQLEIFSSLTRTLEKIFSDLSDLKCHNFACMLVFTLLKNEKNLKDFVEDFYKTLSIFIPVILRILESEESAQNSDFIHICFEAFLESPDYLPFLTSQDRVSLLSNLPQPISTSTMSLLSTDFTYLTDILLTTTLGSISQLVPTHILSLTHLLAESASQEPYRAMLQSHKSLVLNNLYLLKMVHEAGKAGVGNLSVLGKLSDVEKRQGGDKDKITESPTFGFKEDLIQLLTNLVWDHTENKTVVGELEGVALILDCSQMDARNPFITQRVVLAVRGLTNDHPANQEILAGLKKMGAADGALLKELGMKRDQEGKIRKIED
eukprot:GFUD01010020.1.p1 GENE.GFUD01010020.1~~GFUD01010020.1.p1  ORF type:complete len:458 (+),score=103.44 GFUD01010020.1:55-1374(+)